MSEKVKNVFANAAPLLGLVILIAAFLIFGVVKDINIAYGFRSVINQSVVVAVVATGAIFIYALGSFDISLGASVCVSALLGGMVYLHTENVFLMLLTCLGVAVLVALVDSLMASVLNLPVFVTTIAMLSMLSALGLLLIGVNGTGSTVSVPQAAVKGLDTLVFKIAVLVLYVLLCVFIFSFSPVGRREKYLGGNPLCAKLTGISVKKYSIIAFVVCGIGVGLGAFLSIVYAPTLTKDTGSSIGMDVIIAIVFGGMPVSGGARSKIYAALIGAFSMTFLSQIMTMLNFNSGVGQVVKAVIFLIVVKIAAGNHAARELPR